jgi:23S rRNA (guanosine2251-2'-O)-methyltransferase
VIGRHPVEELLASRLQRARRLLVSEGAPAAVRKDLEPRAAAAGIPVVSCSREEFRRRTGEAEGGVAVELETFRYVDLEEWIEGLPSRAAAFLLDGITDPQNLGAVLRSARAFGVAGVILPKDRSCPVTGAVFRTSAGGAAHVPVVQVTNLARTAEALKDTGFWVYAAAGDGEIELADFRPAARTGIVLGSEETGIRRLVRETCDGSIRIAMEPGVDSLNVSVAAGIIGWCLRKSCSKMVDV